MATATAKKQANTTTKRAKSTARTVKTSAQATSRSAEATVRAAERTARTIVRDSAYATVGLADTAMTFARTLPTKAGERVVEVPTRVKVLSEQTPKRLDDRLATLRSRAESQFDTLAGRGRSIVEALQRNANTGQAREQMQAARKQVRAAAGDLRKAVFAGRGAVAEVVETAGDAVSAAGQAAQREQYEAMTVDELRDLAGRKNIARRSELTKSELISALLKAS